MTGFDDAVVAEVAAERDLDPAALADALATHQQGMADLPGVDGLVYEWRRSLPTDPLLFRTPAAYHLAHTDRVWAQFAEAHGFSTEVDAAVRAVHDRTVRAAAQREGEVVADRLADADAMVCWR